MVAPEPVQPPTQPPPCYAHPDRLAGSICRRCNRPICPECMLEAPVGWQCPSCVKQGNRVSPTIRWRPRSPGRLGNTRITPVVTALVVICVIVYIAQQKASVITVEKYVMWPIGVHSGQYYRLITSAFMHANFEHIFFNMASLAIIGPAVEAEIGPVRFGALYLAAALGGSVASYLLGPANETSVGASGAIFGVMGAYYVLARIRRWDTSTILILIGINLFFGFTTPSIDWRDHLGGLLTGAVVCAGLFYGPGAIERRSTKPSVAVAQQLGVVAVVVVVLCLLATLPPGHVNL